MSYGVRSDYGSARAAQDELPLFGEDTKSARAADLLFGLVTIIMIIVTIAISFSRGHIEEVHIFFGVTIVLMSIPELILVRWFRQGNLDPKFRLLIGYQMITILLLCSVAIYYFYQRKPGTCP